MDSDFFLASGAGRILNRSAATVIYHAKAGRIPFIRTANGIRLFRLADLERFKAERESKEQFKEATAQ
jgi:DNA-binding transcriptional MerR regulator